MKKLLLAILVVVFVSLLFVGCIPTTPTEGEGEDEGEIAICPTVSVTSQVAVGVKKYIKSGPQTVTVTFTVPTEPVSVYIGNALKVAPASDAAEVIMYANADKTVYTGTFNFGEKDIDCAEAYIYVDTCSECNYCKYPYIVDTVTPKAIIEICMASCTCEGCELTFNSTSSSLSCEVDTVNCGDDCSGLSSWSITLFDKYPFDNCCDTSCEEPVYTCSGTECPIECTTDCLTGDGPYYVVVNLVDNVGNETQWGVLVEFNSEDCDDLDFTYLDPSNCLDNPGLNNSGFVVCAKAGKELVNGDFETCDFSGWSVTEGGIFPQVQSDQVYSGTCAAYMGDGAGDLGNGNTASIQQLINIPDDAVNLPLLKINYRVIGTDNDGEGFDWMKFYINDTEIFYVWSDTSGWQEFQYDLSSYTGSTIDLKISAWTSDFMYAADYYVDDISITW